MPFAVCSYLIANNYVGLVRLRLMALNLSSGRLKGLSVSGYCRPVAMELLVQLIQSTQAVLEGKSIPSDAVNCQLISTFAVEGMNNILKKPRAFFRLEITEGFIS